MLSTTIFGILGLDSDTSLQYQSPDYEIQFSVLNKPFDDSYDTYELEITTDFKPFWFKAPYIVFMNSPVIPMYSSDYNMVTLPALFFEHLRGYQVGTSTKSGRNWKSVHYFLGEKQNLDGETEFHSEIILIAHFDHMGTTRTPYFYEQIVGGMMPHPHHYFLHFPPSHHHILRQHLLLHPPSLILQLSPRMLLLISSMII